jgi:hypothetical protein
MIGTILNSYPYTYYKSQFSETFVITVTREHRKTSPEWIVAKNREGKVNLINRPVAIGIAIRDYSETHSMVYHTLKNSNNEGYTLVAEKADLDCNFSDSRSFQVVDN